MSNYEATVSVYNGVPTLFIGGQPDAALIYTAGSRNNRTNRYFRQFGEAGVHLYSFYTTPGGVGEVYDVSQPCWVAPRSLRLQTPSSPRVNALLQADPGRPLFPRLYLNSPHWWDEQHPDELVTFDPGDGRPQPWFCAPASARPRGPAASGATT